MAFPPQVLGEDQVGPLEAVAEALATEEVEEALVEEEATAEVEEVLAELEPMELEATELEATELEELEATIPVALDRAEETTTEAVEVVLVVSTTLGGKVTLVASYPFEAVTTTLKSSRQPPWLVAVIASRLDPHRVHL